MTKETCAVILAGGKSSRMGRDKALIDVAGRPLIRVLADRLLSLTRNVFISANADSVYRFLNLPVIPDLYSEQGPLAGIHAVMRTFDAEFYITLACDLPHASAALFSAMLDAAEGFDAVIPLSSNGRAHPLCAVYRATCLSVIEDALQKGANKTIDVFSESVLRTRWFHPEEGFFRETELANINTQEDLQRLRLTGSQGAEPYRIE